jgi:CubicO group peptidase (beta-lactamase class C family)
MQKDTVFSMASLTKLLTTIAVLQIVERRLVRLDDDITPLVPDLAKQEVLVGFDEAKGGKPKTRKRNNPVITLRQLVTHSFGGSYDFMHADVMAYKVHEKYPMENRAETLYDLFGTPLVFEPGEGWIYSGGLDWAGQVVEKVTGLDLDTYMRQNIWEPLGLDSFTFWPDTHPHVSSRLASMTIRDAKTGRAVQSRKPIRIAPRIKEACGGQGVFGTAPEYLDILHSLLVDDERLLKKETTATMFQPQLSPASKKALIQAFQEPSWAIGDFPHTDEYDWGLGGLLIDGDRHPYRRKGTLIVS